jgi:hypothetical protein
MHAVYEIILQGSGWERGWAVIQGIAANVKNFSGTATQVGKEIATGEVAFGLSIDTYAGEIVRRYGAQRIGYIIPKDYPCINGDGIGVLKGAPHSELAEQFLAFVLSDAGQRIWYSALGTPGGPQEFDLGKLPIIPELIGSTPTSSVVSENPFTWKISQRYDAELGSARWNIVNDLFGVFVIDVHDRLKRLTRGDAAVEERLGHFPVTEDAVASLLVGPRWGRETAVRSQQMRDWGDLARRTLPRKGERLGAYLRWLPGVLFAALLVWGYRRSSVTKSA